MKYVSCPVCGHKLLEGEPDSLVKVKCGKCKTIVQVTIGKECIGVNPVFNSASCGAAK